MNHCELCSSTHQLSRINVKPSHELFSDDEVTLCQTCQKGLEDYSTVDRNHWRRLSESIWSERAPVKILSYRILTGLKGEDWARDLLEQMYIEDEVLEWARQGLDLDRETDETVPTRDSNGTQLLEGDSVTLIKDLEVKGAGFTAKRGTLVKNISLTTNPKHIEGRVNGIQVVLVAEYLKKA